MTYTIIINETHAGGAELVKCEMNANDDEAAKQVMSDLLLSVAKHNYIELEDLNTNLYKTQWISGI